jgi:hypothetical protein
MKRVVMMIAICLMVGVFYGCAVVMAPGTGFIYTEAKGPMTSNAVSTKTGEAKCTSILGLVCTGDCSIQAAAANGGIKKIHHVDYKAYNILSIYAETTTVVYGE